MNAEPIILANERETVEFRPLNESKVLVVRRNPHARWGVRFVLAVEPAREHYRDLVKVGYWRW